MNKPESRSGGTMEWDVHNEIVLGQDGSKAGGRGQDPGLFPFPDEEPEASGLPAINFDLRRFLVGAWQRRWVGLATMAGVTLLMLFMITFSVSKQWQANATLIKRSHQDLFSLAERDPFKSQDYSLATLLDTLKLPSSLKKVAEDAGVRVNPMALAMALDVVLNRDSTILNLKLVWDDPEMAAELANRVAEQFIERTRVLIQNDATDGFAYYSSQLERARAEARAASEEVLAFRQENGISDLDTETKVLLEELSRLWGEYNSRQAETDALRAAQQRLQEGIAAEPEQMIMYTIYRSPLQTRLADYQWELQESLAKYTEENPKVVKLKERIRALEQLIASSNDESVPENTYTQNNKRFQMELRLQEIGDDIQVREAQSRALKATLDEMQNKLDLLTSREKDYVLLQSRLDGILALESQLSRRVEETRLVMQRDEASFDIVERATPPIEPLPSGRKMLAMASLVLAVGCGLFLVLFLEWRDPLVRSLRDVTHIVGHDVSLEIGEDQVCGSGLLDRGDPVGGLSNLFRRLCNDMDTAAEHPRAPLGIVSVHAGEGRSTIAANLALTRTMKGQSVMLLDADLRQAAGPRPGTLLGLDSGSVGLYEYLTNGKPLSVQTDESGKLSYLPAAGQALGDDSGLLELGASEMDALLAPYESQFCLADLPPLDDLEVSLEIAGQLQKVVLVVRSGQTRRDQLKTAVANMNRRGIECVASVVLGVSPERMSNAELFTMPDVGSWLRQHLKKEVGHA